MNRVLCRVNSPVQMTHMGSPDTPRLLLGAVVAAWGTTDIRGLPFKLCLPTSLIFSSPPIVNDNWPFADGAGHRYLYPAKTVADSGRFLETPATTPSQALGRYGSHLVME